MAAASADLFDRAVCGRNFAAVENSNYNVDDHRLSISPHVRPE